MILVDIYVPAVDDNYDFLLDEDANINALMTEITEMLAKKIGSSKFNGADEFVLYHADRETPLSEGKSLYESGVRDGDKLILV